MTKKLEVVNKKMEPEEGALTTLVNTLTVFIRILLFSCMWPTEKFQDGTNQVYNKQQTKYKNAGIY